MKTRHLYTHEHFNLAGEYNTGRCGGADPDSTLQVPKLTLDEYVNLVRVVGRSAFTYDKPKRRPYDELDEILMRIDPA
jgi:hypothetical protein